VRGRDLAQAGKPWNAAQDFVRVVRVFPDHGALFVRQLIGFVQNGVGHAQFSDVAEERGAAKGSYLGFIQVKSFRDGDRGSRDSGRMAIGKRGLGVDYVGEGEADVVESGFFGRRDVFARLGLRLPVLVVFTFIRAAC
jgi:hypothetical protein